MLPLRLFKLIVATNTLFQINSLSGSNFLKELQITKAATKTKLKFGSQVNLILIVCAKAWSSSTRNSHRAKFCNMTWKKWSSIKAMLASKRELCL